MNISEAAKKMDLTAATLRYYEQLGLIPPVPRKNGGVRDYGPDDLGWIDFIKCMRSVGLPIEVLIEYTTLYRQGDSTLLERKEILLEERNNLLKKREELDQTLEHLQHKLEYYDEMIQEKLINK